MSEKWRPNPEQSVEGAESSLTKDQIKDAKDIFERLFETYFSGLDLKSNTEGNQIVKTKRYEELQKILLDGFTYLPDESKKEILKMVAERINLNEPVNEQPKEEVVEEPTKAKKTAKPRKKTERELRHEQIDADLVFTYNQFIEKISALFQNEQIVALIDRIIAEKIKLAKNSRDFNTVIDGGNLENKAELLKNDLSGLGFSDLKEFSEQTQRGKTQKYNFYCRILSNSGQKRIKFELSLTPIKLNGVETLVPKIFETTI